MNFREDYDWSGVVTPVTDEQVKLLVAALRSGKYKQASGQFERQPDDECEGGFCCLGVANEVWEIGKDGEQAVFQYLGDSNEAFTYELMPYALQIKLYEMNDGGTTFEEIANYIEKGFNLV